MPLYEYVCSECRSQFELIRLMKEADDPAPCPRCSTHASRKLSRFAMKRATTASSESEAQPTRRVSHRGGCPCCVSSF